MGTVRGKGKTNNQVEVESYDNRANDPDGKVGFGYVYFTDGTRVCWADDRSAWWNGQEHWGPVTDKHIEAANKFLAEQGLLGTSSEGGDAES